MNGLYVAALTYASTLIILAQAFTLSYITTTIPNFSQGFVMTIGAYVMYITFNTLEIHYFAGYPLAFLSGAVISVMISLGVIEPLINRKRDLVLITLSTLGIAIVGENLIKVFVEWAKENVQGQWSTLCIHGANAEYPFPDIVGYLLALFSIVFLKWMFNNTLVGVSIRALEENVELSEVQGLNSRRLRVFTSFLAGGLSGLAGGIMVLRFHISTSIGLWIMLPVFAAVFLGGVSNIHGAVLGGLIVGLSEIMLVYWGQSIIGVWVGEYRFLVPFLILVITLWMKPRGLLGLN